MYVRMRSMYSIVRFYWNYCNCLCNMCVLYNMYVCVYCTACTYVCTVQHVCVCTVQHVCVVYSMYVCTVYYRHEHGFHCVCCWPLSMPNLFAILNLNLNQVMAKTYERLMHT